MYITKGYLIYMCDSELNFLSHAGYSTVSEEERSDSEEPCGQRPPAAGGRQQGEPLLLTCTTIQPLCTSDHLLLPMCVHTTLHGIRRLIIPPPLFTL